MKNHRNLIILLTMMFYPLLSLSTATDELQSKNDSKQFYVLTIPKAGTFLISKMLTLLTGKTAIPMWTIFPGNIAWNENPHSPILSRELEKLFDTLKNSNKFPFAHFNFAEKFLEYSLSHPEYEKIILIRDLRDLCISAVYFTSEEIEEKIDSSHFDDKLMFIIEGGEVQMEIGFFWKIEKMAKIAVQWMKDPTITVCRFENLVGEKGGGSLAAQQQQIETIARALNIPLSSKKLNKMTNHLFGVRHGPDISGTYREGQIGSWQSHFKENHKQAFNRVLGTLQKELGYPCFE